MKEKLIITEERLWEKDANKVKTKKNIFDFNENIYDKEITVCFYKRLRNERKFKNMDELVAQLKDDKNTALEYINNLDVLKYKL